MKLSTGVSLVGLGLGLAGFAAAQGCSSDDSGTSTSVNGTSRKPPGRPDAPPAPSGDDRTFAVYTLSLGEADRAGKPGKDAWKNFGYDLDGRATTATSKDVCSRLQNAPASYQEDGNEGIDNAFGRTIIPFLQPFAQEPSKSITDSVHEGDFTILLRVKGLTDEPKQTNTSLSGTLLIGGRYGEEGAAPKWQPTDDWPFRSEPQVPIQNAYINGGTFVNGGGATVQLSLYIQGVALDLNIHGAIISFDHAPPNDITNGTIAGIIPTDELIRGIEKVAGRINDQLCSGGILDTIKDQIRQASDILVDGTNRAGVPCDGISVGIGFTGKRVANPTRTAPPDDVAEDPCAPGAKDAGTDAAAGDASSDGGTDAGDGGDGG